MFKRLSSGELLPIFTIGFVAEKRIAFVNPVHNDLFTELEGWELNVKHYVLWRKKVT